MERSKERLRDWLQLPDVLIKIISDYCEGGWYYLDRTVPFPTDVKTEHVQGGYLTGQALFLSMARRCSPDDYNISLFCLNLKIPYHPQPKLLWRINDEYMIWRVEMRRNHAILIPASKNINLEYRKINGQIIQTYQLTRKGDWERAYTITQKGQVWTNSNFIHSSFVRSVSNHPTIIHHFVKGVLALTVSDTTIYLVNSNTLTLINRQDSKVVREVSIDFTSMIVRLHIQNGRLILYRQIHPTTRVGVIEIRSLMGDLISTFTSPGELISVQRGYLLIYHPIGGCRIYRQVSLL